MTRALVFDSGVGGLSVVGEIRKRLPALGLDYAADDAFRPYGTKTETQLRDRLPRLLWDLVEMAQPDLAVVACNTASTVALADIRNALSIPVVGVVPAIKPASLQTRSGTLAVLGTPSTVRQAYVDDLIADFAPDHDVLRHGSVALVEMGEAKLEGRTVDRAALAAEIAPIFAELDVDTVVLACTHFPLLRDELAAAAPRPVAWVDSGEAIARRVESLLGEVRGEERPDTAFFIGDSVSEARRAAFAKYGFGRVVALPP